MKSRMVWFCMFVITTVGIANGGAFDEVNAWRRAAGLPVLIEDPAMTAFAQKKAQYRAARRLKNGHQGPSVPGGWTEGCGEATATWGWLTCATECDFRYGGAGVAIGADGERYMVFVGRGGSGRALINPNRYPIIKTAHLTPNPVNASQRVSANQPKSDSQRVVALRPAIEQSPSRPIQSAQSVAPVKPAPTVTKAPTKTRCPKCGRFH